MRKYGFWLVLFIGMALLLYALADEIGPEDWEEYYLPAMADWRHRDEYGVYNTPWLILILKPLQWLGADVGYAILAAISWVGMGWGAYALSPDQKWQRVALALINLPMLYVIMLGQVDGIALIGAVMAAVAVREEGRFTGIILGMIKPQTTLGGLVISFWRSPQKPRLLIAGGIFILLSVLIWGLWFEQLVGINIGIGWNRAFPHFPLGWIFGLPLFLYGLYKREEMYGIAAMPFLVPYYAPQSFITITVFMVGRLPLRWCWLGWLLPLIWIVLTG